MQVSHVQDHCTHAVIGGKQAIEFGISNSAEFFNILSSTLYKDQILAVVREVLCNAWDAHIEAHCTDRPVLITLDGEKLVIKDFGKGIHHDDMGLIYGTYGNSTKKNDGHQTGGFGLGCKAPFAYTDHFEVISCHEGVKTIYNLSKSSAQAMGKPGITPIASFPTEDTGLTVTIRIQSSDRVRFDTLIRRIVHNGDMNMHLNGKQLDTVGFDLSQGNYLITKTTLLDYRTPIMVRYGNVVYPVDSVKAIEQQYGEVCAHLKTLHRRQDVDYSIVFQAPAHSISVTPSRESLSMQDHTVNTLSTLFADFLSLLQKDFVVECNKYAEGITNQAVAEQRIDQLLNRQSALPDLHEKGTITSISDLETMAKAYMRLNYPKGLEYRKADVTRRLLAMVAAKLLDRGTVQTFLAALKETRQECDSGYHWNRTVEPNSWLQRRVLAPLLKKLSQADLVTRNLYVCNSEDCNWIGNNKFGTPPLVPATQARPHNLLATLPYLRNIIVLTTRRFDLVDRAYLHNVFAKAGRYQGFLVYCVGRKKGEIEAAQQFFTKQGMLVADLTQEALAQRSISHAVATPRKPAKKGIPCLSSILSTQDFDRVSISQCRSESVARIEEPEFVIQIPTRRNYSDRRLEGWSTEDSYAIAKLFGDKGGIVTTDRMYQTRKDKGAKDCLDYVLDKVLAYVLNNPRIEGYWSSCVHRLSDAENSGLVPLIYSNAVLTKEFGLVNNMTEEDKLYFQLWQTLSTKYYYRDDVLPVREWFSAIPLAPSANVLLTKLRNPLVGLLSVHEIARRVNHNDTPGQADAVIQFLITVLNS